MIKNEKRERSDLLYQAILTLQSLEECKNFFSDLCTVAELRAMEQRFEVATLLSGGMIYNDILERTGASSATISRVNRSLQYGANGYQAVLPRLKGSLPGEGDQPADEAGTPLGEADGL
ncbi:MAG: TrpR-like protein [Flavonifractor sp.]|nr:TrpR-like protein [Flavonifractor sp.]